MKQTEDNRPITEDIAHKEEKRLILMRKAVKTQQLERRWRKKTSKQAEKDADTSLEEDKTKNLKRKKIRLNYVKKLNHNNEENSYKLKHTSIVNTFEEVMSIKLKNDIP